MKTQFASRIVITLVMALISISVLLAAPQKTCPVMGGDINKNVFVDYKGYRIYFCCKSCPDEFKKNPEKYLKKMKKDGVDLEKSPK